MLHIAIFNGGFCIYLQEGENNDKFDSHPKNPAALPAYLMVHSNWYHGLDLSASIVLLALALVEPPAVALFQVNQLRFIFMFSFTLGRSALIRCSQR